MFVSVITLYLQIIFEMNGFGLFDRPIMVLERYIHTIDLMISYVN